jgi:hypothetical protein
MPFPEFVWAETEPFHRSGTEILHQHIRLSDQTRENVLPRV